MWKNPEEKVFNQSDQSEISDSHDQELSLSIL